MKIPQMFKDLQMKYFQDKKIAHRKAKEIDGGLGSITVVPSDIADEYLVNFQIISDAVLAKDWGLVAGQDAFVTSSDPLPIANNDYVQYEGKVYKVVGSFVRDSHTKLMLQLTSEKAV